MKPIEIFLENCKSAAQKISVKTRMEIDWKDVYCAIVSIDNIQGEKYDELFNSGVSSEEIFRKVNDFKFEKKITLGEVSLDHTLIPDDIPRLLIEKRLKFKGEVWTIHQNDADPFPSNPHAHNYDTGLVMHLGNGNVYKKKKYVYSIPMKDLIAFRNQIEAAIPDINLPELL